MKVLFLIIVINYEITFYRILKLKYKRILRKTTKKIKLRRNNKKAKIVHMTLQTDINTYPLLLISEL